MKIKMTEFTAYNSEEFENMIEGGNIEISKALVEPILKNLKGRKRHIPAMTVFLEDEQLMLDISVDRKDFKYVLEKNLPIYEKYELYEKCAEIINAIKSLDGGS